MVMTIHGHNVSTSCTERHYPPPTHPPTHPPIPDPPCVCVGTNEEAREKWVMARWMHDEMVMTIHEHNVSTSCTERHYPPPTHPPTPPYQTLHAYVWERMRKCVRSEWWHDECMMKWWWSSKMCKLLTAANADVSENKDTYNKFCLKVCKNRALHSNRNGKEVCDPKLDSFEGDHKISR